MPHPRMLSMGSDLITEHTLRSDSIQISNKRDWEIVNKSNWGKFTIA